MIPVQSPDWTDRHLQSVPKICISFGVSGAIQHTEGIKDTNLYVAVNTDENAAIFGVADYGIQADLKEILENYLTL